MKKIKIVNTRNDLVVGEKINEAISFIDRTRGLMFTSDMHGFDGLLIRACNSVHTCFMNYAIDLVFINQKNIVIKCIKNKKPWGMTMFYLKASSTLELPVGVIDRANIVTGDLLRISYV